MSIPVIVAGDDTSLSVTLKKDATTFDMSLDTAKAVIVSNDKLTQYSAEVDLSSSAPGANWLNSLVVVDFTSAQTAVLSPGQALLEIQVTENGSGKKTTWFGSVRIMGSSIA